MELTDEEKKQVAAVQKPASLLVVRVTDKEYSLIINEMLESFRKRTGKLQPEQMESERLNYRKGLYKDEIFKQIIDSLI